jgi:hypothetical protein
MFSKGYWREKKDISNFPSSWGDEKAEGWCYSLILRIHIEYALVCLGGRHLKRWKVLKMRIYAVDHRKRCVLPAKFESVGLIFSVEETVRRSNTKVEYLGQIRLAIFGNRMNREEPLKRALSFFFPRIVVLLNLRKVRPSSLEMLQNTLLSIHLLNDIIDDQLFWMKKCSISSTAP